MEHRRACIIKACITIIVCMCIIKSSSTYHVYHIQHHCKHYTIVYCMHHCCILDCLYTTGNIYSFHRSCTIACTVHSLNHCICYMDVYIYGRTPTKVITQTEKSFKQWTMCAWKYHSSPAFFTFCHTVLQQFFDSSLLQTSVITINILVDITATHCSLSSTISEESLFCYFLTFA